MKKLIAILLLTLSASAIAQHHGHGFRHNGHHNHHYRGPGYGGWVAPLIIGGAIGYTLTRPEPVIIQQPPNIIYSSPVYGQNQTCTSWTETQHLDGSITRTRTCSQ